MRPKKCAPTIWDETREGTRIATDRRVHNGLLTCSTVSVVSINSSKDMNGCTLSSLSALIAAVVYIEAMRFGSAHFLSNN